MPPPEEPPCALYAAGGVHERSVLPVRELEGPSSAEGNTLHKQTGNHTAQVSARNSGETAM